MYVPNLSYPGMNFHMYICTYVLGYEIASFTFYQPGMKFTSKEDAHPGVYENG
jgi:hypothetical protein